MKPFEVFTKDDFDVLRATLAAHLSKALVPEAEHREMILKLIHDIQLVAADKANQLLNERGVILHGKTFEFVVDKPFDVWSKPDSISYNSVGGKEALLVGQREIEK